MLVNCAHLHHLHHPARKFHSPHLTSCTRIKPHFTTLHKTHHYSSSARSTASPGKTLNCQLIKREENFPWKFVLIVHKLNNDNKSTKWICGIWERFLTGNTKRDARHSHWRNSFRPMNTHRLSTVVGTVHALTTLLLNRLELAGWMHRWRDGASMLPSKYCPAGPIIHKDFPF